mgnify:CR=1 FL=1
MLRHFFNDFMTFVPLQLPQLLDVTTMEEAQFYGDYALLTFPLRDPYDLEEVMDLFEDDMELITLYHHIPTHADKFGHSTCAYSNPAFGQMFKMNCKTDAFLSPSMILLSRCTASCALIWIFIPKVAHSSIRRTKTIS